MYKIMIIEDDKQLSSLMRECLERYRYTVYEQTNFHEIVEDFLQIKPDLVLLDIELPYFDGFHVCRTMRKSSNVPIIITSARSSDMDQIMAIELGADDYIIKPFTHELLLAKVKAALRRSYGEYAPKEQKLVVRNLTVCDKTFTISYREQEIDATKNEYQLIKTLIENRTRIVTREELFEQLWDEKTFVDDNTLTVNITRIKQKLMQLGLSNVIKTKRGVGYYFDEEEVIGETHE